MDKRHNKHDSSNMGAHEKYMKMDHENKTKGEHEQYKHPGRHDHSVHHKMMIEDF